MPRLINQVCDHALLLACAGGKRQVEPALVEEAWADLQQLPTPWNEQSNSDRNIIEFGGLDDEPADAAKANAADTKAPEAEPTASDSPAADAAEAEAEAKADAEASSPSLHVVPEIDESEAAELEPTEQLQRIQRMLADVEQEFCPAGTIGPEVELVFAEPEHPFRESFQEEEVIRDRYATRGKRLPRRPARPSRSGRRSRSPNSLRPRRRRPTCPRRRKRRPRRPRDRKTLIFRPGSRRTSRRQRRNAPPPTWGEVPSLAWGLSEEAPAPRKTAVGAEVPFSWENTETTVVAPVEHVVKSAGSPRSHRFDRLFANLRREERARR